MINTKTAIPTVEVESVGKLKLIFQLLKFRLSFLVAFSASFGYLLATKGKPDMLVLVALSVGGFLVSGASIIINQILEKDLDKLMKRTATRPLPTERMSVQEAMICGIVVGVLGLGLLAMFTNILTAFLSLLSMVMYGLIYTPLKRVGVIAVWVGAIPGALPPLLGWVAATGEFTKEGLLIFLIQFVWQFPHFWAIAWVADEDYKKAGFRLLPAQGECNFNSALQIMIGALILIPVSLLPAYVGITGTASAVVAFLAGILFLLPTLQLLVSPSRKVALRIMFASFIYLPVIQIAFLLDKV
ncbi:MAG: protoheme IX farnesyltransferase [Bacteroidetes bacterium]|nr:MAG: protoheme IX farnesyltransferase [Bacteroidota bacterium]